MLRPGFFRSPHFFLSAIVALAVLTGGALGYRYIGPGHAEVWFGESRGGCDAPATAGTPIDVTPQNVTEENGERRDVTYRFDPATLRAGTLDVCNVHGEILVEASETSELEVRFAIRSRAAAAVEATVVRAALHDDDGALRVWSWVEQIGSARTARGNEGAGITIVVALPANGAWAIEAGAGAGDVRVLDVLAASLDLESNFGTVHARGVDLEGNATLRSSAGSVMLVAKSVQSGAVQAESNFGDVEVRLPQRVDVGYDVAAETNFGEATVRIGPTEHYASEGRGGEREEARSTGYDAKPTRVVVRAESSAGDVTVVAE